MKWKSKLHQKQQADLAWYFDNEAETAAGNRSSLGGQLDAIELGVTGVKDGRTHDMDRASGAYRRQANIRNALAALSTEQARVLRAVYKTQQPSMAVGELVAFFGDHGIARVAVMRCELPAPGASAVRILSTRLGAMKKGDKTARRELERSRARIIADVGEAEDSYIKSERLCRMERGMRMKKKRARSEQLLAQTLESEKTRPWWWQQTEARRGEG